MQITIDIDVKTKKRLDALARRQGMNPSSLIQKFVAERLPLEDDTERTNEQTIELLRSWIEEDASDDVEELKRRDLETESLLTDLAANRLNIPARDAR